jgi:hypothetical protein
MEFLVSLGLMSFLSINAPVFLIENTPQSWWVEPTAYEVTVQLAENKKQPIPKVEPKKPQKVEDPSKIKERLDNKFKDEKEEHPEMWDKDWIKKATEATYKVAEF